MVYILKTYNSDLRGYWIAFDRQRKVVGRIKDSRKMVEYLWGKLYGAPDEINRIDGTVQPSQVERVIREYRSI
jgi:hypothetical protein